MGLPEATPSPPHLYPQTIQLIKLYQAFIFSIPILFSIIVFLLLYLFYLKRRISIASTLPTTFANQTPMNEGGFDGIVQNFKLPVIAFGEDSTMEESQCCCICLGEYEMEDELQQLPPCKHIFHSHCISHWLRSNSTCPICRCPVFTSSGKLPSPTYSAPVH
ncbi:unnamed protein product [Cuscuta epithymum]|uniref:RING-type domain-containing protein n=1 Tax=Cuscuta epithymum TaxID=186058 RepID=A0AAV0EQ49_9ASTE|nr:unnamed protein product [Cuscuta epithymum]